MSLQQPLFSIALAVAIGAYSTAVAGQATKYGVTVQTSKPDELAKAKTYSWTRAQPSPIREIDLQIVEAVDHELTSRGFMKVAGKPSDLVVSYASLSRTDVDLKGKTSSTGALPQFPVGMLILDLRDTSNSTSFFKVRIDKPIDTDREHLKGEIESAVAAMFQKYPTAQKR